MTSESLRNFELRHVSAFLEKLRKNGDELPQANSSVNRLFWLDSDVLSDYVDGKCTNHANSWPSLFSLTPDEPGESPVSESNIAPEAIKLSNSIARAISQFLLGHFRATRHIQNRQLWMMPEQQREFDSIAFAALKASVTSVAGWQEALFTYYKALYEREATKNSEVYLNIRSKLSEALDLMIEHSESGKLTRIWRVQKGLVQSPVNPPVFPEQGPGSAFVLDMGSNEFSRKVNSLAKHFLKVWKGDLAKRFPQRHWQDSFAIKDAVLKFHQPNRRMSEYLDFVRDTVAPTLQNQSDPHKLMAQARATAKEISDVFTLARLAQLGTYLAGSAHTMAHGLVWEICFISGSARIERLFDLMKAQPKWPGNVKLIHPLVVMRFDQFLYPVLNEKTEQEYAATGRNFALDVITRNENIQTEADKDKFLTHLQSLMTTCAAAFSPQHDRSLTAIRRQLEHEYADNLDAYVQAVRETITKDFVKTFQLINQQSPVDGTPRLSMISLPWLSLPFSEANISAADDFIAHLHDTSTLADAATTRNKLLARVNKDDPTGYTDMLCAALGHLARGKASLRAAVTLANSAAVLALNMPTNGAPEDTYQAEGNEALYLCAFVSRMSVHPGNSTDLSAIEWRKEHAETLKKARGRVDLWCRQWPKVVEYSEPDTNNINRRDLVLMRYDAEDSARETFCWLFDVLLHSSQQVCHFKAQHANGLLASLTQQIAKNVAHLKSLANQKVHPALAFISAQLFISSTQVWTCAKLAEPDGRHLSEKSIEELEQCIESLRPLLPKVARQSELIKALEFIFCKHSKLESAQSAMPANVQPNLTDFAGIDKLRINLLGHLILAEIIKPQSVKVHEA